VSKLYSISLVLSLVGLPSLLSSRSAIAKPPHSPLILAQAKKLPARISTAVRQDLYQRTRIPIAKLKIFSASPQTWSDGCLGLPKAGEACTQSLVYGWRVGVSSGSQLWMYRTDETGRRLRLENAKAPSVLLPAGIAQKVLADAAARSGQGPSSVRLSGAAAKVWSDSCLGLGGLNALCAEVLVPGWEVVAESDRQRWVYRTNAAGTAVLLDQAGSQVVGQLIQPPQRIPPVEMPAPLPQGAVFQVIRNMRPYNAPPYAVETTLLADGNLVMKVYSPPKPATIQTRKVKPEDVQEFQQLVNQRNFARFNQIDYPAPAGAINFDSTVLLSPGVTTRYANAVEAQLSEDILQIMKVWQKLTRKLEP
jgi:hypothetical protein